MSYAFQLAAKTFSNGAVVNTSPPTFGGVASVVPNTDGSFTVNWAVATGAAAAPIRYEIFVSPGSVSAATLFTLSNRISVSSSALTSARVFVLQDQTTYFVNGQTYTFGVRAVSAQNISDTNTVVLTSAAIGTGNLPAIFQDIAEELAATEALLALTAANGGRAVPALTGRVLAPETLVGKTLKPDILIGRLIDE